MHYYGSQANAEFGAGVDHLVNSGKANDHSITLNGGLQADADTRGLSPHSVISTAIGAGSGDDSTWERYSRVSGDYEPGSMPAMTDQISSGSDSQE
jgi:hypothetical protein